MRPSVIGVLGILASATPVAVAAEDSIPRAVEVARATGIPACTVFIDAAATGGKGTADAPFKTIKAGVEAAEPGGVICVAEGTYAEELEAGEKPFTLAGGFQSGKGFKVRDSAAFVSKAQGNGGSFLRISDPGPKGDELTAIDGFEITGYSQAIVRDFYEMQRFDITNNYIHDNTCKSQDLAGAAFALVNTSGTIKGNVIRKNACGRGGGGTLVDNLSKNTVLAANNLVDANSGTEPEGAHGGAFYFFVNNLTVTGNLFTRNTVTQWGGGLYVGAYTAGSQFTNATMRWNTYIGNRAGDGGGGFFCDDGANCTSENELYLGNCGGNVLVDGGSPPTGPTTARFNQITSIGALTPDCSGPGIGFYADTYEASAPDSYAITNAIFWGNADGQDVVGTCDKGCEKLKLTVDHSMLKPSPEQGIKITYGSNIITPADPLFVAPDKGDFRLKPGSPAAGKGSPAGTDLGAYGKSTAAPISSAVAVLPTLPSKTSTMTDTSAATAATKSGALAAVPAPTVETAAVKATLVADATAPAAAPAADDTKIKQAFEEAKALGTIAAWRAFLHNYPDGFYSDMAGAYLRSLGYEPGSGAPSPLGPTAPSAPASPSPPVQQIVKQPPAAPQTAPTPASADPPPPAAAPPADTATPAIAPAAVPAPAVAVVTVPARTALAVKRGAKFFGFPERFNRYYTEPNWKPARTIFAGPNGGGDGSTREKPATLTEAVSAARPGTLIHVLGGVYKGGIEFTKEMSGTFEAPIVLFGQRNASGTPAVSVDCAVGSRQTCFNFEGASYIAVDGFDLVGGSYGVRAVGLGFPASEHSRGNAIVNCKGRDQQRDPFKTAQSDWSVIENNIGFGAGKGDGHGIYISGGSDWGIVRSNETHSNASSDLQINADPASSCQEVGVPYNDPRCDGYAGQGEGGQGASDYFLVEANYSHRSEVGPNFTSLRRSMVRNNVFGPQTRHNATFWQETDNPKLGSTENRIYNNLFITTKRHAIKFENNSGRNIFGSNLVLGVSIDGKTVTGNPSALLMETDASSGNNLYHSNVYVSGTFEGRKPGPGETTLGEFSQSWFKAFPTGTSDPVSGFAPAAGAPFLDKGKLTPDAPADRMGIARREPSDPGPIELP